jgi:hypothetical protein
MKTFYRDSTVRLKFNFFDPLGNPTNPNTASVTISYIPLHQSPCDPTFATYPLTLIPPWDWTFEWDSRGASAGVIPVHAQTEDGTPVASVDAEFRLKANRANRGLTGDWYDW